MDFDTLVDAARTRLRVKVSRRENSNRQFATDVLAGLTASPKCLSPKYFYDTTGSQLFEEICNLAESGKVESAAQLTVDSSEQVQIESGCYALRIIVGRNQDLAGFQHVHSDEQPIIFGHSGSNGLQKRDSILVVEIADTGTEKDNQLILRHVVRNRLQSHKIVGNERSNH